MQVDSPSHRGTTCGASRSVRWRCHRAATTGLRHLHRCIPWRDKLEPQQGGEARSDSCATAPDLCPTEFLKAWEFTSHSE